MIKRTNKISANKAIISEQDGELFLYTYDKEGNEEGCIKLKEFLSDFLEKDCISITVGYDLNL